MVSDAFFTQDRGRTGFKVVAIWSSKLRSITTLVPVKLQEEFLFPIRLSEEHDSLLKPAFGLTRLKWR